MGRYYVSEVFNGNHESEFTLFETDSLDDAVEFAKDKARSEYATDEYDWLVREAWGSETCVFSVSVE